MAGYPKYSWARRVPTGKPHYEVSSVGDKRFSALYAVMTDGRTIEQWYQCDVKGYGPKGYDWKMGKGKPSKIGYEDDQQYELYVSIWRLFFLQNLHLLNQLKKAADENGFILTDCFATSNINQARALAQILNEWMNP